MVKIKIQPKFIVLFLAISLLPLVTLNFYWYYSSQSSLKSEAETQQKLLTASDVYRVNQYMNDKIGALIIHSQSPSVENLQIPSATADLNSLMKQDMDIQKLTLLNSNGVSVINIDRKSSLPTGQNLSQSDAFKASTFLAGKEYISPITFTKQHHPMVTIAVPLVSYSQGQNLANLSTAESNQIRTTSQINGVLIEQSDLNNLWQSVLAQSIGTGGYAYVVDSKGTLIAYPNLSFQASHQNLNTTPAVEEFLANPNGGSNPITTVSEKGIKVLSTYGLVSRTGWGVIAEEPMTTIFASARKLSSNGLLLFAIVALLVVAISLAISRQITRPIRELAAGADALSSGNLTTRIKIRTNDEIGGLAGSFNKMALSLGLMLNRANAETDKANVMLNNVGEGILALDEQGKIIVANVAAAVLIGDMPKNIINKSIKDLYNWTCNGSQFDPSLKELGVYRDIILTTLTKRVHYIDIIINPIEHDPSGIKVIMTISDKTQERELENMKVDFVSMAAHELRTPMTTIRGYIDLIRTDDSNTLPPTTQDYFSRIEASSVELVGLINNLLNVSRIERGSLTLKMNKLDWTEVVKKSISDQQFTATAKKINLRYVGPDKGVFILADDLAMTEVINNLIANALNYTPVGGDISVHIWQEDKKVVTEVIDNGVGIPEASISHLFSKFYRAKSGLSSGSGGSGLGLFICKSIVEMHHGLIGVKSVEGEGSTFSVTLPKLNEIEYSNSEGDNQNVNRRHGWIIKNTSR